jgi:hypothetical protein
VSALWQELYDAGAEVVLASHEHNYERFAPQTSAGVADPARGLRQFVVGTGGRSHYSFGSLKPNSEARNSTAYGVLRLTLRAASYDWQFVPVTGTTFSDSGSTQCHSTRPVGYARPKSATPVTVKLVPAFAQCVSGNATHGPPFARASCSPPVRVSNHLTIGGSEADGKAAASTGRVRLKELGESPIDLTNGDQADVQATVSLTDVFRRGNLSDYTGQLEAVVTLRMTDRRNGASLDEPATATDYSLRFAVPCFSTAGPEGASCQVTTTADGVVPGIAREGSRAVWRVVDVRVFDGGADGIASTQSNSLFAVGGFFVP